MDSYASGKPSTHESLLSRRKQAIIARSMAEIERQLDQWLENDALRPGPNSSPPMSAKRKRARDEDNDDDNDNDNNDHDDDHHQILLDEKVSPTTRTTKTKTSTSPTSSSQQQQKRTKRSSGDPDSESKNNNNTLRYACPFAKHDPVRYRHVKTCCGPGWGDPHRVKEHVYRRHSLRNACNRCFEFFGDAKALKEHHRSKTPCHLRDKPPTDVISDEQEEKLRARAKPNAPAGEKWEDMYRIIFPGVTRVPSPFYESTDHDDPATMTNQSRFKDFDECKAFVRREVLRQVKPVLVAEVEKAFQVVEKCVMRKANELVREVQSKIFRTWRFQEDQAASHARHHHHRNHQQQQPHPQMVVQEATPPPAAVFVELELEPEPEKVPELADIGSIITSGFGDDPMFSFLVPEGGFNWDFFMAPPPPPHAPHAAATAAATTAMEEGLLLDCDFGEGSVGDSAYFTSSSGVDDGTSWAGGSYVSA